MTLRAIKFGLRGLVAGLLVLLAWAGPRGEADSNRVALLTVNGAIGPAVSDYIERGLDKAVEEGAVAVVIRMDTPGGLDTSMRAIIKEILASPVPVIGFVGPSGARAASAGTYILYATHVAAMAPATNLGAATPVQMGAPGTEPSGGKKDEDKPEEAKKDEPAEGDDSSKTGAESAADGDQAAEGEDEHAEETAPGARPGLSEKAINDAVAYIRGLAQMRGRNADWAVKAVTEAAALSAEDALAEKVIDLIANDVEDLLDKVDGRVVTVGSGERTLKTAGATIIEMEPDWRSELLAIITNPTVAYMLLFTIGVPALLIEFYTGTMIAGVIGAICIVLGLYGLHLLPIDYAGLGLVLLGLALLVAEAVSPAFGVLGLGGLVAFVVGSVMLIDTDVPGFGISPYVIGSIAGLVGAALLLVVAMLVRIRRRKVVSGAEEMLGSEGEVLTWSGEIGEVRTHGEVWQARAGAALHPGARIRVTAIEGLTLVVEPEPEAR